MPKTKIQKKEALDEIKGKLENAKAAVFTDYSGIGVNDFNNLRAKLDEAGAQVRIVKNSLLRLINKDIDLEGQTAVVYSEENQVGPIKVLFDFRKETQKPTVKLGLLDGKIISAEQVEELSKLPSMDELRAKLVGTMKAPISNFVGVNRQVYSGFVRVLDQVKNSKS